jgi:putative transposase
MKRFSEEQIVAILKEHEAGMRMGDLGCKRGISQATHYCCRAKYGGMEVSGGKRLWALEDENGKLER